MRIHVVNPNTTLSMTRKIGAAAKAAASPGVEVSAVNPALGPPSIEGYFDEAFLVPGLIEEIGKARNADAFVIACFDDTGLEAGRCATLAPAVGSRRLLLSDNWSAEGEDQESSAKRSAHVRPQSRVARAGGSRAKTARASGLVAASSPQARSCPTLR
jgi:hypothetical protein